MTLEQIIQNSVAPVIIVAVFLWYMDRAEKQRAENAKQLNQEQRQHETTVFNLFASTMKQMINEITASNEKVIDAVNDHEAASNERYKRQGNTQDINKRLDAMQQELMRNRK